MNRRILVLGGSSEAHELLSALVGFRCCNPAVSEIILSLAGHAVPLRALPSVVEARVGGFGGVAGLGAYLRERGISDLVDATHPFAATMAQSAATAAAAADPPVRIIKLLRPASRIPPNLTVRPAATIAVAAELVRELGKPCLVLLGSRGGHQLLSLGTVPSERLWRHNSLTDRRSPPEVLRESGARLLLLRDSGGALNQQWLNSAAEAAATVILLSRPPVPSVPIVDSVAAVIPWLES